MNGATLFLNNRSVRLISYMEQRWVIFLLLFVLAGCSKDALEQDESKPGLVYPDNLAERISDPVFLRYCYLNWDQNEDGIISKAEAVVITNVDCSGLGISSLAGIEYIPNLKDLDCSDNNLTELDCRYNEHLITLNCNNNRLKKLDLSDNPSLEHLYADNNPLEYLDFGDHTTIDSNHIPNEQIVDDPFSTPRINYIETRPESNIEIRVKSTSLRVKAPNALVFGRIENLTLDECHSLQWLECDNLGLKTLNIESASELIYLSCADNVLQRLNLSGKSLLRYVNCCDNKLQSLNLNDLDQLTHLSCGGNPSARVDISSCSGLTHLVCSGCQFTTGNFSHLLDLEYLSYENCTDASLNFSENAKLKTLNLAGASGFNTFDFSKLEELEWLGCENCGLTSLTLPAVKNLTLDCSGNRLTGLDLSALDKVILAGGSNRIEELVLGDCVCVAVYPQEYRFNQSSDVFKVVSSGNSKSGLLLDCSFRKLDLSECLAPCDFQSLSVDEIVFGPNPAAKIILLLSPGYSRTMKISGSALKGLIMISDNSNDRRLSLERLDLSECPLLEYVAAPFSDFQIGVSVNILILKEGQKAPVNVFPTTIQYI